MEDFSVLPIEELLREGGFECECGVHHETDVKFLKVGSGVVKYLPDAMKLMGVKKPFIVCDEHTRKAAWSFVEPVIKASGIEYTMYMFSDERLEPDERAMGALTMHFDPSCDVVLAIGTGVVNDCSKVLAKAVGRDVIVIGTAPSMDGYASNSSSMIVDGVKTSLYNPCAKSIILDTDIMKDAPMRMLWAGLGDMLAKYVSLCEWKIASMVHGDLYCPKIAALIRRCIRGIVAQADKLSSRDPQAIGAVAEGLVLSGIAMGFATNSRPASGLEHYFSHVWDMMALERGEECDFHGIQVGVGTYLTIGILNDIAKVTPDREKALAFVRAFDEVHWEKEIRRIFGRTAEALLAIERQTRKNDPVKHAERLEKLIANWDAIKQAIADELPPFETLDKLMRGVGMPCLPAEIGIDRQDAKDALWGSRDIRDKYLTSTILWDLGLLDEYADGFLAEGK